MLHDYNPTDCLDCSDKHSLISLSNTTGVVLSCHSQITGNSCFPTHHLVQCSQIPSRSHSSQNKPQSSLFLAVSFMQLNRLLTFEQYCSYDNKALNTSPTLRPLRMCTIDITSDNDSLLQVQQIIVFETKLALSHWIINFNWGSPPKAPQPQLPVDIDLGSAKMLKPEQLLLIQRRIESVENWLEGWQRASMATIQSLRIPSLGSLQQVIEFSSPSNLVDLAQPEFVKYFLKPCMPIASLSSIFSQKSMVMNSSVWFRNMISSWTHAWPREPPPMRLLAKSILMVSSCWQSQMLPLKRMIVLLKGVFLEARYFWSKGIVALRITLKESSFVISESSRSKTKSKQKRIQAILFLLPQQIPMKDDMLDLLKVFLTKLTKPSFSRSWLRHNAIKHMIRITSLLVQMCSKCRPFLKIGNL